jgi:outer membrane protein assembly factor BamB
LQNQHKRFVFPKHFFFNSIMKLASIIQPALALAFMDAALSAFAQTPWTSWRGPGGTGSTDEANPPVRWSMSDLAWKVELPGKGTSTPVVQQGKIFLTSPLEGQDAVLAYDFSGKQLWKTKLGAESPPKHRTLSSGGNASPVTDGTSLFVYFKSGNFASVSLDGKVQWQVNLVDKFGREQLFWDQGSSPVVTEDSVIFARLHGGESWVAGFDKKTGEVKWKQSRNYKAPPENDNGYTTPVLFNSAAGSAFLLWGADMLTAHQSSNGKLLWELGEFNKAQTGYWPAIASPGVSGDIAVVPVGRDDRNQASLQGIRINGQKPERVWTRDDTGVFVASPAVYKGRVYLLRHKGEVVCLDPANGKTLWTGTLPEHRTPYYSSPVIAAGHLYAAREDGTVFVAGVQDKFQLVSEIAMGERIIASPVPTGNYLLLRGDKHLFAAKRQ